MTKQFFLTKWW